MFRDRLDFSNGVSRSAWYVLFFECFLSASRISDLNFGPFLSAQDTQTSPPSLSYVPGYTNERLW